MSNLAEEKHVIPEVEVMGSWAVADRWWTDHPEHRVYAEIRLGTKHVVLRYDRETDEVTIQEPR